MEKSNYHFSGVYKIESALFPGKIYIGSTKDLYKRFKTHRTMLKLGYHNNKLLQEHYNTYGMDDLLFSILLICNSEEMIAIEKDFVRLLDPYFNIHTGLKYPMIHREERKRRIKKEVYL
jgi:group I intron endonuclease